MSSQKTNLRKSSSMSHIPQPKSRSRSTTRSSSKDSVSNFLRVPERLSKRSISLCPLKRSTTTPVLRAGSIRQRSSSSTTPASSRRSPFLASLQKKSRPIDDKKWVIEQFHKVQNYILEQNELDAAIIKNLKPCTINSFVYVCGFLFAQIDSRIEITPANYKEVVLRHLKTLRYPGNVSLNLLKTVNTIHSWPQVISIFSWLIDLINLTKRVEDTESQLENGYFNTELTRVTVNYLRDRYLMFNNNKEENVEVVDELFKQNLDLALNVDNEKIKQLQKDVAKLVETKNKHQKKISIQNEQITEMKADIERKHNEIHDFYTNYDVVAKENTDKINNLREKKARLEKKLRVSNQNVKELTETILKQSCSAKEKIQLLQSIEDKKFTLDLKKDKIEEWKNLKSDFDWKFVEAKRKIQTEVYRLNSALMPLTLIRPDLKSLKLSDDFSIGYNLQKEITDLIENQNRKRTEINNKIATMRSNIIKIEDGILENQNFIKKYNKTKEKLEDNEREVLQQIAEKKKEMELLIEKYNTERQFLSDKLKQMENNHLDLEVLKLQIKELREKRNTLINDLQLMKENALMFFTDFARIANNRYKEINEILNNITGQSKQCTEDVISQQNQIGEDLEKLREDLAK